MNSLSELNVLIEAQRIFFHSGETRKVNVRIKALKRFRQAILQHESDIYEALSADFNKSRFETWSTEIGQVSEEIRLHIRKLKRWSKSRRVPTPLVHFPASSRICPEPYGNVLIIAPWNYPFQLALMPFVGAISAGNTVVLKTAHYSEHTSAVMARIIAEAFPPEHAVAVGGGREVNGFLLDQVFDYLFFTGSPSLGRLVMEKAAVHLTPVTLELGGKSPCLVTRNCNVRTAAKRIIWGKFVNAGQTCVAPDYLLVEESVKEALVTEMIKAIRQFYGNDPRKSPDFPRIINTKQWERLKGFLGSGTILYGGENDPDSRYIAPTLMDNVSPEAPVMGEEIFGPILPILTFKNKDEAVAFIVSRPKPLACYLFTENKREQHWFCNKLPFGGGCINDTIVHVANPHLPFGGLGNSGMGRYHGTESFKTFSHYKSVLTKGSWLDVPLRYPPYNDKKLSLVKTFIH